MPDPSLGELLFLPYRHMEQRILDAVVAAKISAQGSAQDGVTEGALLSK